jgi:hypothetical protein
MYLARMDLAELLYWDTISDLVSDDVGIWEVAWRANTLSGRHGDFAKDAAATVIGRLVNEGLATPVDESGAPCNERYLGEILDGETWARASGPTPMVQLRAVDEPLQRRYADIPHGVGAEVMSRQNRFLR